MNITDLRNGLVVAISEDVDLFPLTIFRRGLLGTVTDVNQSGEVVAKIVLHKHFEELDEWDNALFVLRGHPNNMPCTAANFEPVDVTVSP